MRNIYRYLLVCIFAVSTFAEPSPFSEPQKNTFVDEDGSVFADEDFQNREDSSSENNKMMFLDSVQKHFWNPKRKPQDNTVNIIHRDGDTHKIRTRYAMTTTIVFDNDKIAQVIFGDPQGFELKELGKDKWDLSNIITIRPKMIGIDTNLTVIGESGTIYTFYIFSTHFTNRRDPAFTVFVSKDRSISKIAMTNLEEDEHNKKAKNKNKNIYKRIEYEALEEDDGEFISIGDRVNKIQIEKAKIKRGYVQVPKATRSWKTLWLLKEESPMSVRMMPIDIFNDNDYTYFKFDREDAMSKFPVLFKVVDGYDNPVNVKIVGNYIIAEDLSEKWTLKMGDEYICIRKVDKPLIVKEKFPDEDVRTIPKQHNEEEKQKILQLQKQQLQKNAKKQKQEQQKAKQQKKSAESQDSSSQIQNNKAKGTNAGANEAEINEQIYNNSKRLRELELLKKAKEREEKQQRAKQ
ncbi:conjugal transfer protein [Helicobacter magdeburgensis]|uniref:Conjugal transfer protein n=1 Tax=Helicobacter magdeburgensis TaxID=471858 RepID=A0A4U8T2T7_9HELI|nr:MULTISPECIES: TrbG/VirB9 family P-type conjugative transfer protein [Helicobacter]TLD93809.1 conjugal transfer protein [Helicobacter magdeburgensis]BDB64080.1 hypothetical protein T36_0527 [Helicobacter cinaedi]BDB65257.1 hypothetical protein T36_1733 [Helicobacter cinaedi]